MDIGNEIVVYSKKEFEEAKQLCLDTGIYLPIVKAYKEEEEKEIIDDLPF